LARDGLLQQLGTSFQPLGELIEHLIESGQQPRMLGEHPQRLPLLRRGLVDRGEKSRKDLIP
jgi:hypothetical protein